MLVYRLGFRVLSSEPRLLGFSFGAQCRVQGAAKRIFAALPVPI